MPNTPSSSFIPRQGPAKRSRQIVSHQVHVFTVVSYVLFFGALTASAGVFLYSKHVDRQLEQEIVALDAAIANFSTEKMEQVKAFNTRLLQATDRIDNTVSAASIFQSLETSTAQSVSLTSLSLKRVEDETFLLTAEINTDTFDSALFQRGLFERNPVIEAVSFEDVSLGTTDSEEGSPRSGVSFEAELKVPLSAVPYKPDGTPVPLTDITVFEVATTTTQSASSTELLPANQTGV
jgi:exonuclease VII small subunit